MKESVRLLLIDTCGETAGVAVCAGREVVASEDLPRSGASAEIVAAVRRLLEGVGWRLAELDAVGVVSGPGSFTGMRTGLAAAKGLCEAAGLRLVGVSRLEVLADAAGARDGVVALDAGRGEMYVRDVASGRERLCGDAEVIGAAVVRPLRVVDALGVVLRRLDEAGVDAGDVDAYYVRAEADIYRKGLVRAGGGA
jgi:tRNA threonylcarbamoyladenosine biosynthesis protein TsaB